MELKEKIARSDDDYDPYQHRVVTHPTTYVFLLFYDKFIKIS